MSWNIGKRPHFNSHFNYDENRDYKFGLSEESGGFRSDDRAS